MSLTAYTRQDEKLGEIIHLENGDLAAEISIDYGSNLISLTKKGQELIHTNLESLVDHAYTGCFVLYPFPNRIRDRKFIFDGVAYSLNQYPKRVNDDALIHGVAHDGKWSIETDPVIENEEIVFSTIFDWDESQEYFKTFPLKSRLTLRYRLSKTSLRVEYIVTNTGNRKIPFGFALHPSFRRLSGDETTIALPAKKVMRMDEKLLPTGELLDLDLVMFRQFDLRKPVPVNAALRLDHVFTDIDPDEHSVISYPTERFALRIYSSEDCKYIVLHTLGKDRTIEIEPQTCSTDAVNSDTPESAGLMVLDPNMTHEGFIEYKIDEI